MCHNRNHVYRLYIQQIVNFHFSTSDPPFHVFSIIRQSERVTAVQCSAYILGPNFLFFFSLEGIFLYHKTK